MPTIAFLLLSSAALLQASQPAGLVSFDEVARRALPSAAVLAAEAELAGVRRDLAASSRGLLDEPVLQVTGGPRWDRDDDSARGDVELELELPWRGRSPARRHLADLAGQAAPLLVAAAHASAWLDLRHAYVDAWHAQELLALRERGAEAARRLAEVARAREAAGADPPFEAQLADLAIDGAASSAAAAAAELEAAWRQLEGLTQGSAERPRLAAPSFLEATTSLTSAGGCEVSGGSAGTPRRAVWRAVELRAELAAARSELDLEADLSRFSWVGSVAREGREDVARVGVALLLPRQDVRPSRRDAVAAGVARARRDAEISLADLAARWSSASALLRSAPSAPAGADDERYEGPLAAIEARLTAGRASPAEALTLRRQVLALQEEALERAALREHAAAEAIALCAPVEPVEEVTP